MLFSLVSSPGFKLGAIVGAAAVAMATTSAAEAATFNVTGTLDNIGTYKMSSPGPGTLSGTVTYDAAAGTTDADILLSFMSGASVPNIRFNQVLGNDNYSLRLTSSSTPNTFFKFKSSPGSSALLSSLSAGNTFTPYYAYFSYRTSSSFSSPSAYGYGSATFTPNATGVPTPALLPGLVGFGVTLWRKRRNKTVELIRS